MNQSLAGQKLEPADGIIPGTHLLNGQYLIQSLLQKGGFGITYVARDSLDRQVVVKECFPWKMCVRVQGQVRAASQGMEAQFTAVKSQFVREARQVAKFDHPNIISVHQVFEENNTAYMAMDQVEGADLFAVSDENPERLTNDFLLSVLSQILDAIGYVHDHGILHCDMSPDNILVDATDRVTLIDFGAALEHQRRLTGKTPNFIAVKDGYSPHEFYEADGIHDVSSDLYAVGASLYHMITGAPPANSHDRLSAISKMARDPYVALAAGDWNIDHNILVTVDHALEIFQENRFQSAAEWQVALQELPKVRPEMQQSVIIDPNLEATIARLVENTNTKLKSSGPEVFPYARIGPSRFEKPSFVAPTPKPVPVDIFGTPIEDVAAWQAAEERKRESAQSNIENVDYEEPQPTKIKKKSLISNLVSRCLPTRKDQLPSKEYS